MVDVETSEALHGGILEFQRRHSAVEVGVSRGNRLGDLQQAEAARSRFVISTERAREVPVSPAAATLIAAGFAGILGCEDEAGADLGRDDLLVVHRLIGIDFAVMIRVESLEKALRVRNHLIASDCAVMVEIGLLKPDGQT